MTQKNSVFIDDFMTPFPHTIGEEQNLIKAKEILREFHCHHLPVKHGGKLVGILSSSDLRFVSKAEDLNKVTVGDVMTTDILEVPTQTPVREAVEKMLESHCSSVLVTRKPGELLGIFTWIDLARAYL